jgi:hypothetical protein
MTGMTLTGPIYAPDKLITLLNSRAELEISSARMKGPGNHSLILSDNKEVQVVIAYMI